MAVPTWLLGALLGNPVAPFQPLVGEKAVKDTNNLGLDALLIGPISAMDATGPKSNALATDMGNSLTGQDNLWGQFSTSMRPMQPMKETQSQSLGKAPLKMPLG